MKSGHILTLKNLWTAVLITALTALVSVSCSIADKFVEVRIEVSEAKSIDFDKFDKIVYADLLIKTPPKGYTPVNELKAFFVDDLSRTLDKPIEHLPAADMDKEKRMESITERLKESPNSLLITGETIFDIKTRSKIEEKKNKEGKKEKTFVRVQHWTLTVKVELVDVDTGETLFKKSYSEKLGDADVDNPKYNFDDLFFKINNRFAKEITSKKRTQRRYLITG